MLVRLTKILGPSVGRLAEITNDKMGEAIAGAIFELSDHLTEEDLDWICEKFGRQTEVELGGKKLEILDLDMQEIHFAGEYGLMIKWLGACLEVNFQDFFDTIRKGMRAAMAFAKAAGGTVGSSRKSRPESSPGSSGESYPPTPST
jgi:hypothetical protein